MIDNNRLLLELEQTRKKINRATLNPEIKKLAIKDMEPILQMVADARIAYVTELIDLAAKHKPSAPDDITRLTELHTRFKELVDAANALETMVRRGYVDVQGQLGKS
ncbi:MAG: hypothetical protein HKN56_04695 [Gammaproteobacteria bacterium]|nr:hypothetical protein [Gammaproteobacteria bacterium]